MVEWGTRQHAQGRLPAPAPDPISAVVLWLVAWVGTIAAGGTFGLFVGGGLGMLFGPIVAGVFAAPIFATTAIVTWALWLTRWAVVMAAVAGALTGISATAVVFASSGSSEYYGHLVLAGLIGGAGAGVPALWYMSLPDIVPPAPAERRRPWRFSLRGLFVRFTVVTLLIAFWTSAVKSYLGPSPASHAPPPQPVSPETAWAQQAFAYHTGLNWPEAASDPEILGSGGSFLAGGSYTLIFSVPPEVMAAWFDSPPPWGAVDWISGVQGAAAVVPVDKETAMVLQHEGVWYTARDRGGPDAPWQKGDLLILEPDTGVVRYCRWDE